MLRKHLTLGLALALGLSSFATAQAAQGDEPYYTPYTVQRNLLNLESVDEGSFDLSRESLRPAPVRLRLHFENSGEDNVKVTIPQLQMSYLVPGNTVREHDLNLAAFGDQNEVVYMVEHLPPMVLDNFPEFTDISHITSSSYITPYVPTAKPEPRYWNSGGSVRGYW